MMLMWTKVLTETTLRAFSQSGYDDAPAHIVLKGMRDLQVDGT